MGPVGSSGGGMAVNTCTPVPELVACSTRHTCAAWLVRCCTVSRVSLVRVCTTSRPLALSAAATWLANDSVTSFSSNVGERRAPASVPPCAASTSTCVCCAPAAEAASITAHSSVALVQGINREAAQQLRVEVSGFLRHHLTGKGDVAQLLQRG